MQCTGQLLEPDDVTFAVMVRGYGDSDPPQWAAISALLGVMQSRYDMNPSTGAVPPVCSAGRRADVSASCPNHMS